MFIPRHLQSVINEMNQVFPVILLTGPRQVGKTTLLQKMSEEERTYITLDDPLIRELAVNEPGLFMERYSSPLIIDEIQYAPGLLPYIKMKVDRDKTKGQYWLTGSQMFHLMKGVSESLAGRVGVIQMPGLTNREIGREEGVPFKTTPSFLMQRKSESGTKTLREIFNSIIRGSMPALYENPQDISRYYSSYVATYLQRDIRYLTQVGDELAFMRFMQSCAARTSRMLNYADLAKDVGISAPTAKQWLSLLVSSGIVFLLEPYHNNVLKRIVKAPNMYFMDTGLCAYLTKWSTAETLEVSAMAGAFFETMVVTEIIKSYYNAGRRPPVYYYRDSEKREIDLILEADGVLYPIEIKMTANPGKDDLKHFKVLHSVDKPIGTGNVICMTPDLIPANKSNYYVPAWML